jgi:hypothetical protein
LNMKTFKRKTFYTAVLAAMGAMTAVGTANAVNINPDGLGQALIYPYFTVRASSTFVNGATFASGQQNTYFSVVNSTATAKAVKVRILEGKNSREILDFNLFLSPNDVWTAAILPNSADATAGAKIITTDKSCTTGVVTATGIPFSNGAYTGIFADLGDATLDRTNEGYMEILEMGEITHPGLLTAVTHVAGVAPCMTTPATAETLRVADDNGLINYLTRATGGLFGAASLINPATGVDYSYDAIALEAWDTNPLGNPSRSTAQTPTIANGNVLVSNIFSAGAVKTATWLTGRDAVSATMMRNKVLNEFVLDTGTQSATDWVVTFPTKRFYTLLSSTPNTRQPFQNLFTAAGSCDDVTLSGPYNREEQFSVTGGGFSPATVQNQSLCWEANVITFNQVGAVSNILGSKNVKNVITTYQNGWMGLNFAAATNILTPLSSSTNGVPDLTLQSYRGLPVVGFMVQNFINGTLATGTGAALGAAFGGDFAHKYTRAVCPAALGVSCP